MKKLYRAYILIAFLVLCGCDTNMLDSLGDDSSDPADIEEARIALDDGDYDRVISLLADDYDASSPDPEAALLMASAYMGKAGVDLTYVIENVDTDAESSFDIIASALNLEITSDLYPDSALAAPSAEAGFNEEARFITLETIQDLLVSLEEAQAILENLIASQTEQGVDPDEDQSVQLGMASALHFILQIGLCVGEVTGTNIPINSLAYKEVFPEGVNVDSLLSDLALYLDTHEAILTSLRSDLIDVYSAVLTLIETIGADEDITEEFDAFMRELLVLGTGADDEDIILAIENFSGSTLSTFISNELLGFN